ncbi:MAG: RNA methyltransferase [Nitriliruptorales bacterium]|nr:RNA methyltransferase [Nitriliruptorales bacterium]
MITSSANPAVKAARKLARRHARAKAQDAFLVEGPQAVAEGVLFLSRLFVGEAHGRDDIVATARDAGVEILTVSDSVLSDLATTVTPQPMVGVATLPSPSLEDVVSGARLLVVLDQVRDPGNVGTALRTADAAGADGVILSRGSVDPRNPKAVRSSAGSLFHLPVVDSVGFSDIVRACRAHSVRLVAAAAEADTDHTSADLGGRVALVLGSEAHGLPPHVQNACDLRVRIPMHRTPRHGYRGSAESLNLAATVAILTYEAVRQRAMPSATIAQGTAATR